MASKGSGISVTDQFCGAGGSSQGARRLGLEVQLALNHWPLAVQTHNTNFPETAHDCADISATDPRRYWPTDILITSPECTSHTYADGKKKPHKQMSLLDTNTIDPAAERSRATMFDVSRFAEFHQYNLIIVENVVEVADWILFDVWLLGMQKLGYEYRIVYLNSMFAHVNPLANPVIGRFAPQSRDRMYVVFWRRGNKAPDLEIRPLAWCHKCERDVSAVQTWKNTPATRAHGGRWGRYGAQYVYTCPHCSVPRKWTIVQPYYYAAANAIDWTLPAERIGDRSRPLRPKTLKRIEQGLEKFGGQQLVVDLARPQGDGRVYPLLRGVLPTQTTKQTGALVVMPYVVETLYTSGNREPRSVTDPLGTFTTRQSSAVVIPPFLLGYANGDGPPWGADDPLRTLHTANGQGVVVPPFLTSVNYFAENTRSVDGVLPTQTTGAKMGVVVPPYLVQLRNNQDVAALDDPLKTFTASGSHHALVVPPFMLSYYGGDGNLRPVDREIGTVTPMARHGVVFPGDRQEIHVEDCGFRMLEPEEIKRGMAFDDDYVVLGKKREQVRQCGLAVTPPAMELLLERAVATLH